jgi:hypothetical protein
MTAAVAESQRAFVGLVSERQFQAEVIRRAKLFGWLVHHSRPAIGRGGRWNTPIEGDPGYIDLTLARSGRLLLLELKSATGKTSPAQRAWISTLSQVPGVEVHVLTPNDWPLIDRLLAA